MSEAAAAEIFGQRNMTSPTWVKDISGGESNELTNSDFEPVTRTKYTESCAEKNSFLQLTKTASKATSLSSVLCSNNGGRKPLASFKRWCVDRCAKLYKHVYYCLFLSIVVYIYYVYTFMQISWSIFFCFMIVFGYLLSVGTQSTGNSSEAFPQKRQKLQLPISTAPRLAPIKSNSSISEKSLTLCQNSRAKPQTLGQHEPSTSQRPGRKDPVPMAGVHGTTSIVDKSMSFEIQAGFFGFFLFQARFFKCVVDFSPFALLGRKKQRKSDGGKGKQSTPKHGSTNEEKVSSSNKCTSKNTRRNPQAGNVATRTNDVRKKAIEQSRAKHGSKTEEKTSSAKQRHNTNSRREVRHPGSNKAETRTHDVKKGAPQKQGPKRGEKASSNKRQNTDSRRDERGARAGNSKTQGAKTGQKASSNKQRRNTDRDNRA